MGCKPFMAKETYDNMILKPSFDHLPEKHVSPANLLKEWGGSLEFDMNAYIEWRAVEEGLEEEEVSAIFHPSNVRIFEGTTAEAGVTASGGYDSANTTESDLEAAFSGI